MPALDSIKEAYEDYLKKVYPNNDISDAQKRHIKLAFYGGALVHQLAQQKIVLNMSLSKEEKE